LPTFAVFFKPGPKWKAGAPLGDQEGIREHPAFLARQMAAGTLVMGGPFMDGSGGLSVFEVESRQALDGLLATDLSVTGGLLIPEVHEWRAGFNRHATEDNQ